MTSKPALYMNYYIRGAMVVKKIGYMTREQLKHNGTLGVKEQI